MNRLLAFLPIALALWGCDRLPRDVEGTTERVMQTQQFRVGLVLDGQPPSERQQAFVQGVSDATSAWPFLVAGAAEPLLTKLEEGSLDVVVGSMSTKSPWRRKVHFLPPLDGSAAARQPEAVTAMVRNGENEWVALLHREAEEVAALP